MDWPHRWRPSARTAWWPVGRAWAEASGARPCSGACSAAAGRLLGLDTAQVQHDRFGALDALVQRYACTVVLKGAGTLVGAPGRRPCVIGAGNPGMATGGMGDLLTGTIAAMRAQGLPAFEAACAGALLHSLAGDAAAREGQRGLLPSDLLPWLRRLANPEA